MFKETADIQTADMLKLPVPEAHYHSVVLKPSETQKEMVASLSERAERVRNKMVDSSVDNMLLITNDGRKLGLDQRLINPLLPDDPASKLNECVRNIFRISYNISSDIVFVSTAFSRWIVYLQDNKVKKLSHENYRMSKSQYRKKQKMKCTEGYHKQKLPSESFFEVIQYIKYHDAGTVKRMVKKSRLEKLLEMVEMELKMKNMEKKDYGYDNMPELRRTNIG